MPQKEVLQKMNSGSSCLLTQSLHRRRVWSWPVDLPSGFVVVVVVLNVSPKLLCPECLHWACMEIILVLSQCHGIFFFFLLLSPKGRGWQSRTVCSTPGSRWVASYIGVLTISQWLLWAPMGHTGVLAGHWCIVLRQSDKLHYIS